MPLAGLFVPAMLTGMVIYELVFGAGIGHHRPHHAHAAPTGTHNSVAGVASHAHASSHEHTQHKGHAEHTHSGGGVDATHLAAETDVLLSTAHRGSPSTSISQGAGATPYKRAATGATELLTS